MSKKSSYISNRETAKITRRNRQITRRLEKLRKRKNVPESYYKTKMKDEGNVVEFDNVCSYFL